MSEFTIEWATDHGVYKYYYMPDLKPENIADKPGNYIFAKPLGNGRWEAVYAGSTPNGGTLKTRLPNHEQLDRAWQLGATLVCAHVNNDAVALLAEERDLIASLNPVLNVQHRTAPVGWDKILSGMGS